ncbi:MULTISPECIES: amidohydrolase [unclassified Flavobacterium]|uniref:amidohydrolase n=1 Tax=unclassified Flavobacterium TaxID=196869 RepID=UPI001E350523|nr:MULTISPECIES: amidohydrolase [unclassified Flavobacterium]
MKNLILSILAFAMLMISCKKDEKLLTDQSPASKAIVYYNGDIITMEGKKPTYAQAIVVKDGKILFVGKEQEAMKQAGSEHIMIDLEGKTMLPAFLDAHSHFLNVGFTASVANLLPPPDGPGADFASIINAMNQYKNSADGKTMIKKFGWILGNGYDDSQLKEADHPKAADLDKISTTEPVVIVHQSGHLGVLNSYAMKILGINKDTKDPAGGKYRRNADGTPNGVLEEGAFFAVLFPILGKGDAEANTMFIDKALVEYAKNGYLTVQEGRATLQQMSQLEDGANSKKFYLDIVSYPDVALGVEKIMKSPYYSPTHQYKNKYRIGGVKLTLDGSPQGKTAWLSHPYHIPPAGEKADYKGQGVMTDRQADDYVALAFKNKWQLLCHTNGDAAIDQYLEAIDLAEKKYNYPDHRTVLIHGQTLRKDQIPELVRLKVIPSLFPMHTFYWGDWHLTSVLGHPRADYISPMRDAIDAGLITTSHHDAPVTFPNSMRVLDATVNRVTRSGKILGPNQRITPYEGLKTLTEWAAIQYFEENSKGTLTKGKLADLVILDKNPLKINPMDINTIQILESIKEGKTVFKN